MKKNIVWKILLFIGICPIIAPFISGIYKISIESWSFADWLILYSFVYWPSYVVGLILIILSGRKLSKH